MLQSVRPTGLLLAEWFGLDALNKGAARFDFVKLEDAQWKLGLELTRDRRVTQPAITPPHDRDPLIEAQSMTPTARP